MGRERGNRRRGRSESDRETERLFNGVELVIGALGRWKGVKGEVRGVHRQLDTPESVCMTRIYPRIRAIDIFRRPQAAKKKNHTYQLCERPAAVFSADNFSKTRNVPS